MSSHLRIGIDSRGALSYAARVASRGDRPEIRALLNAGLTELRTHPLMDGASLFLSVPDDDVLVRPIQLDGREPVDRELQGRFELAQAMLDDEADFMYEIVPTAGTDRFLGLMIRRDGLIRRVESDYRALEVDIDQVGYRARAVALGRGYLSFCRQDGGEFVCLADFSRQHVSICFVYQRKITSITHVSLNDSGGDVNRRRKRLAAEFKTVVSYQTTALANEGIDMPLSTLYLCGEQADAHVREMLADHFSCPIRTPAIDSGYFPDPSRIPDVSLANYVIALGLTVD